MTTLPSDRRFSLPSLTRIADFDEVPFDVAPLDRSAWRNGQYVACRLRDQQTHRDYQLELRDGRLAKVMAGDQLIGALGRRAATLQVVGDWESVSSESDLDLLSIAGVVGKCTSSSPFAGALAPLHYLGHVMRDGRPMTMADFVAPSDVAPLDIPVILIIGTSMDAGKTLAASRIIRLLTARGLRVVASKLTGVGRYRDVLAMKDAGAETILDFVDAGLPSTVVPPEEFGDAIVALLARMGTIGADVAVIEAGASPLEPYNGDTAVALLHAQLCSVVLCASDPYAAAGVMNAFDLTPSFVAGRATATSAGASLTARLTGRPVVDLLSPDELEVADAILFADLERCAAS